MGYDNEKLFNLPDRKTKWFNIPKLFTIKIKLTKNKQKWTNWRKWFIT